MGVLLVRRSWQCIIALFTAECFGLVVLHFYCFMSYIMQLHGRKRKTVPLVLPLHALTIGKRKSSNQTLQLEFSSPDPPLALSLSLCSAVRSTRQGAVLAAPGSTGCWASWKRYMLIDIPWPPCRGCRMSTRYQVSGTK